MGVCDSNPALQGLKLLLVDDNLDNLVAVRDILQLSGIIVTYVETVQAAMEVLQSSLPDIILCDIRLPDEFGYALTRQLRTLPAEQGGNIPAIAMTGLATELDRQRCLDAGFQVYLAKPLNVEQLLTVILHLTQAPSMTL
ncbi:hypothetical protein BST81_10675 [Leptolyngbya sp. 'hensonii']|uniref:response regulator n=1 Tax=Leptolyngbya sp. 'hensonii' TaxID=1922337 RepID=UPI00094FFEE7|nr:response regulator [Leptolyngbya sp. 'hensonii']OLP18420.1 hypothetical protein BST81_10675 [Leptolyngbya sp. 'hensonii']